MDFQNIFLQIANHHYSYNDLKNSNQEWIAMFSTVKVKQLNTNLTCPTMYITKYINENIVNE